MWTFIFLLNFLIWYFPTELRKYTYHNRGIKKPKQNLSRNQQDFFLDLFLLKSVSSIWYKIGGKAYCFYIYPGQLTTRAKICNLSELPPAHIVLLVGIYGLGPIGKMNEGRVSPRGSSPTCGWGAYTRLHLLSQDNYIPVSQNVFTAPSCISLLSISPFWNR